MAVVDMEQVSAKAGLLLADFRALPGMEGGPVIDGSGALVGMVAAPLCIGGYELPVVMPAAALAAAISASLPEVPSISRQPACSAAAVAACCKLPSASARPQQAVSQHGEPAVQVERGACSAAAGVATAVPGASPLISALSTPARGLAALLQAMHGVVGCSLSTGQWASGIIVNR